MMPGGDATRTKDVSGESRAPFVGARVASETVPGCWRLTSPALADSPAHRDQRSRPPPHRLVGSREAPAESTAAAWKHPSPGRNGPPARDHTPNLPPSRSLSSLDRYTWRQLVP